MTDEERLAYANQIRIARADLAKAVLHVEIDDTTNARLNLEEAKGEIEALLHELPRPPL